MLKVSARNNSHGFSLLELVIVVFLIALFSIVAVLRIGVSQGVVIESEAQQFAQRLNLLMDESLLSGRLYRIVFDAQQQAYEYQRYDNGWNAVSEIPFKKKSLPSAVAFELDIKQTALSFFLYRLPVIKDFETQGLKIELANKLELSKLEKIVFRNKNQEN